MHAFLISTPPTPIPQNPDTLILVSEKSLGIEEVRHVQNFLSKKPIQESHNAVYILDAHLLTIPAQNALLKTLEEPPGDSQIYLVTSSPDTLLPTVLSRVQLVSSTSQVVVRSTDKTENMVKRLVGAKTGEKLAEVDKLNATREQALDLVADLEQLLHKQITDRQQQLIDYATVAKTRTLLQANVNIKLALDALLFGLK